MRPERKPPNRIISFRKALREFIEQEGLDVDGSIASLLAAVDEAALEYLEER